MITIKDIKNTLEFSTTKEIIEIMEKEIETIKTYGDSNYYIFSDVTAEEMEDLINELKGEKEMNNKTTSTIIRGENKIVSIVENETCKSTIKSEGLTTTFSIVNKPLKMRIKYFEGATKLQKITKGNWIDVYANKDVFVPVGERAMIPLGFALELPQGWEGHLAPRSSTFKTWGVIQTNHVGVIDDSFIGDNDQWHMPVYCLQGKGYQDGAEGTMIYKGDKIGQFRIMEVMPEIEFEEVESFGNTDRGGFGTTSSR